MAMNAIKTVKIKEITQECVDVITIIFNGKDVNPNNYLIPKPGQFVMVWVPGVDEIPMSISGSDNEGNWNITVKNVGECTKALHNLKVGEYIGIQGPLGNGFKLPENASKKCYLIGGSVGMAPLKYLALNLLENNFPVIIVEGAKNKDQLIFQNSFNSFNFESLRRLYCTNDGSYGTAALASELFENLIIREDLTNSNKLLVYACGPEKMIYEVFQTCEKYGIELQASLERVMRCGCGLCGLCAIDPLGLLVCKDGPVFTSEKLRKMEDFGRFKRDFTGKKIMFD